MIFVENIKVVGFEDALRGMRNPMNSWKLSDSEFARSDKQALNILCKIRKSEYGAQINYVGKNYYNVCCSNDTNSADITIRTDNVMFLGPNDRSLCKRLDLGGPEHRKFLRMIIVYMDITAPLCLWKQLRTYSVGTVFNSCSTMHKGLEDKYDLSMIATEDLTEKDLSVLKQLLDHINAELVKNRKSGTIAELTSRMSKLLPGGLLQRRTVMMNYEVLRNIYFQRRHHKLEDWKVFCNNYILNMPYFKNMINIEEENT